MSAQVQGVAIQGQRVLRYPGKKPLSPEHAAKRCKAEDAARADLPHLFVTLERAGLRGEITKPIIDTWKRRYGQGSNAQRFDANSWVRRFVAGPVVARLPKGLRGNARADNVLLDDDEIRAAAEELANTALRSGWPCCDDFELAALAHDYSVQLPRIVPGSDSARLRATDPAFWRRQISAVHVRAFESVAIAAGCVNRRRALYVSDRVLRRVQERRRRNEEILSSLVAVNENGDEFTVQELADKSPSNPIIKRAELMVRVKGLEAYAQEHGDIGVFITLTAPGWMHARQSHSGDENPNFRNYSPRQVHQYLNKVWARTRAQWARDGFHVYGVRTVEPHHDGTPHWHMLLFVKPADRKALLKVFRGHALAESPEEKGAWLRRFTHKRIDPTKGSAVGYLAKYISKNIDGWKADGTPVADSDFEAMGKDVDSRKLAKLHESARRVTAWASSHGIRQFQFLGTTPVTVWRELRRLSADQVDEGLREYVIAADTSNWHEFVRLCGGPSTKRGDLPVLAHRVERETRYQETVKVVKGVTFRSTGEFVITRIHEWTICPSSLRSRPPTVGGGCERSEPWTRVNNCTQSGPIPARDWLQPENPIALSRNPHSLTVSPWPAPPAWLTELRGES